MACALWLLLSCNWHFIAREIASVDIFLHRLKKKKSTERGRILHRVTDVFKTECWLRKTKHISKLPGLHIKTLWNHVVFPWDVKAITCGRMDLYFTKMSRFLLCRSSHRVVGARELQLDESTSGSHPYLPREHFWFWASLKASVLRIHFGKSGTKGNEK